VDTGGVLSAAYGGGRRVCPSGAVNLRRGAAWGAIVAHATRKALYGY
jgi:hypothetical protein